MSINIEEVIGRIKREIGENTYNYHFYVEELQALILMDKYIENLLYNIYIYSNIPDRLNVYIQALHELLLEKNNELTRRAEKRLAFENSTYGRAIADWSELSKDKIKARATVRKLRNLLKKPYINHIAYDRQSGARVLKHQEIELYYSRSLKLRVIPETYYYTDHDRCYKPLSETKIAIKSISGRLIEEVSFKVNYWSCTYNYKSFVKTILKEYFPKYIDLIVR